MYKKGSVLLFTALMISMESDITNYKLKPFKNMAVQGKYLYVMMTSRWPFFDWCHLVIKKNIKIPVPIIS